MSILKSKLTRRLLATALLSLPANPSARGDNFTWEPTAVTGNWDSALNWAGTPNAIPDDNTDFALVNSANTIPTLVSNRVIGALTIRSGGDVRTGNGISNYALTVQESLTQNGRILIENVGSSLTVRQSPMAIDLDTDELVINSGGLLAIRDGAKVQVDKSVILNAGGQIQGNGILELNYSGNFANNGVLRANTGGSLSIVSTGLAVLDLDGTNENGIVVADSASRLIVSTATSGPFNGYMYLFSDSEIQINTGYQLSSNAVLSFSGGNGTATLSGTNYAIHGDVFVNSGTAVFAAPTFFGASASVEIDDGAAIQFDAQTLLANPSGLTNGYDTTIIVNAPVQIGTGSGYFNWDGESQNQVLFGNTIIHPGGSLTIDVDSIDQPGQSERYSATITMNSGGVNVQNAAGQWEIDGYLNMSNTVDQVPVLSGADLLFTGRMNVGGAGVSSIHANATFDAGSDVVVHAGAILRLGTSTAGSQTTIAGGTWIGDGTVDLASAQTTVTAATTIDMPQGIFDLDGNLAGNQLILNAPLTLNVKQMDDDLSTNINDDLRINSGGRLAMNLTDPNASYGTAEKLELNGVGGALTSLHLTGSAVRLLGTTLVSGNSATSARTEIVGQMNIAGAGTFQFRGGTVDDPSWVRAGASVTGTGDLVVSSIGPGYLRLEDGATVGVELVNRGTVDLGPAAANATVAAFTQMATGTYVASIDGLSPDTQYDQLDVSGVAKLDGTLQVEVNQFGGSYSDPASPGLFDEFELILAAAVTGKFDSFFYDGDSLVLSFSGAGQDRYHVGQGLFRVLDYDAAEMDLLNYRALLGDANGDGQVDGSDFGIWNANKFTAGTDWTTGDFNGDGVTDGSDFGIWNSNKFTGIELGRPGRVSMHAVPEPSGLWTVAAGLLAILFRSWFRATR